MKRHLPFILCLLLFFVFAVPGFADEGGYTIGKYRFSGFYRSDNTVDVEESIEVFFSEPRHGIYRSIPTEIYIKMPENGSEAGKVKCYKTTEKNLNVKNHTWSRESKSGYDYIKIGDPNRTVSGRQVYNISYKYVFPDDRYDLNDFIYYSVLGADWNTTINHFTFDLTFENGIPDNYKIFAGEYGFEGQQFQVTTTQNGNTLHGEAFNIQPENAITVYALVEEGYFSNEEISNSKTLEYFFLILAFVSMLLALITIIFTRQKQKPVPTVEFYPPDDITSAEVGMIIDNSSDNIDIISLIPWLAHKGYISIREEEMKKFLKKEKVLVIKKLKKLDEDAPEYLKKLYEALFPGKKTEVNLGDLPSNFASKFNESLESLKNVFKDDKKLYEHDGRDLFVMIISTVLTGFVLMNNSLVSFAGNFVYCFIPLISFIAGLLLSVAAYKKSFKPINYVIKILLSIVAIGAMVLIMIVKTPDEPMLPSNVVITLLVVHGILCAFAYRLVIPTDWNIETAGKLLGLKHFIETAELPRLKALIDENPEYFFDVLPYAMVFGLTDKWSKLFADIKINEPDWYLYSERTVFDPVYLTKSISTGIQASISTEIAKSVSASSGGGHSGGGGGGGGGGSW